jgi:cofilin
VYKIEGGKIVTDVRGESQDFNDFLAALPPNECRYAINDWQFTTNDGRPASKIALINW